MSNNATEVLRLMRAGYDCRRPIGTPNAYIILIKDGHKRQFGYGSLRLLMQAGKIRRDPAPLEDARKRGFLRWILA